MIERIDKPRILYYDKANIDFKNEDGDSKNLSKA